MPAVKQSSPVGEPQPPSPGERAEGSGSFLRFELPDICFTTFVGDIDATVMTRLNEDLRRAAVGCDHVFLLIDNSLSGSISPEARRLGVEGVKNVNVSGGAVFGASFQMRVLMTLAARVVRLFRGEKADIIHFFATEAEARAWIAERRRALFGDR